MNSWRTHSGSVSLSAALMMASAAPARADDWAFEWIEIEPPSGYTLATVHDVNNLGHILCRVRNTTDNYYYGAVFRDDVWHILDIDPSGAHDIWVTDINNEGTVVGYSGVNSDLKGRAWSWNAQNGAYDDGADLGTKLQVWSINDFGEMAGFDVDNNEVVGWLALWSGWTPLNPLENGDSTATFGLNQVGSPTTVVGLATEKIGQAPTVTWDVACIGSVNPTKIDPNQSDQSQTPYVINDNGWTVGSRVSGSSYAYILWRPDGQGGWGSAASLGTITGSNPKAVGLNNSNEVVAKKTLFYEDGEGALQSVLLTDIAGIPLGTGVGQYSSSHLAFYAINDNGWIVGKTKRYLDATNTVDIVMLLVPFDRNNDADQTPDYREIIADPELDTNLDWVLDTADLPRPGLHAPLAPLDTNLLKDVDNVHAVRMIFDHDGINGLLNCQELCDSVNLAINRWGHNINGYSDRQKELVATIRVQDPIDAGSDYLPDAQTQAAILADLREFAFRYARCIDYVQLGNEVFSGEDGAGGIKVYDFDCGETTYSGWVNDIEGDCLPAACDAVIEWMQAQARAIREGSAMAGRPIQVISPATAYGALRLAIIGDSDGELEIGVNAENRAAFAFECIVEAANADDWIVDVHYHYFDIDESLAVSAAIPVGGAYESWPAPNQVCALEYGPVPSNSVPSSWWTTAVHHQLTGRQRAERFFDENTSNNPYNTWDEFVEAWLEEDVEPSHPGNLPEGFLTDGFADLGSRGYRLICFADPNQTGGTYDPRTFDMSAMVPGKVKHQTPAPGLTIWAALFEAAATDLAAAIGQSWQPHPDPCSFDCETLGSCQ